jgi:hypothetical protein
MQRVVRNLLEVRRAAFPSEVVTSHCTNPAAHAHQGGLDRLGRQRCQYSHCQTLVLTDHNAGQLFYEEYFIGVFQTTYSFFNVLF